MEVTAARYVGAARERLCRARRRREHRAREGAFANRDPRGAFAAALSFFRGHAAGVLSEKSSKVSRISSHVKSNAFIADGSRSGYGKLRAARRRAALREGATEN